MADFDISFKNTLQFEGGYTNDPDDNGNWTEGLKYKGQLIGTNKGITARQLMIHLGRIPFVSEMKNLSDETAKEIYRRKYWSTIRGDEILNQEVANSIYDSCVNMGPKQAIILAQRTLGVDESGIMDNATLKALNNKR